MNKFEEARKKSNELTFPYNMFFDDFITSCEKTEKLLKLYKELNEMLITNQNKTVSSKIGVYTKIQQIRMLENELSKGGN